MSKERADLVGPVIEASDAGRAIVTAILSCNPGAFVEDRGAYFRVRAEQRCLLTREAAERELGHPFRLPADLEPLMPAFKGLIRIAPDAVEWSFPS